MQQTLICVLQDSEVDEHEETEEEFLNRYAKAAVGLQDGTIIEEGDVEEQDHVIELGRPLFDSSFFFSGQSNLNWV